MAGTYLAEVPLFVWVHVYSLPQESVHPVRTEPWSVLSTLVSQAPNASPLLNEWMKSEDLGWVSFSHITLCPEERGSEAS